jgi:dihydroflavonol-4-reductase
MTKILVTGGTGFLGAHLIEYLTSNGHEVLALRRENSPTGLISDLQKNLAWHTADILDTDEMYQIMQGIDQVYHCAAMVSFHPRDKERMHSINVTGTANIVNAALHNNIKKLVHVSSIAALGRSKDRKHLDENTKWMESGANTQYAISKYKSELEVWRGAAEGLNVALVNPAVILGAGFWDSGTARFFTQVSGGLKFWPPGQSGMVDVRDVVRFMYQLMESDVSGERYVLSAEDYGYRNLFNGIADRIGAKRPIIKVTPLLAEVAWRVEWLKEKVLGTQPMVTRESARASLNDFTYGNQKSKAAFGGFVYTPVEKTLDDMAAAWKETGNGSRPARLDMK